MPSKRGFSRRPLMTSRGQGSQHHVSTRSDPSKKPHPETKKTREKSTKNYHAKTGCIAPLNGTNAWMGEELLGTPRMTPQGTSPSSPTYTPQRCITMTTTKTPLGHYPHGSSPLLEEPEPRMPHS